MNNVFVLMIDTYNHGVEVEVFEKRERVKDFLFGWLEGDEEELEKVMTELNNCDYYEDDNYGRPWSLSLRKCRIF